MKKIIHKALILLALSGTAVVWLLGVGRAQPEPPPPSPEETIQGQQFTATGQIYSGPLFSTPPEPSPEIRARIEEEMAHPRVGPAIPVTPRSRVGNALPTKPLLNAPQAPGDFVFFKNSILGSGTNNFTSIIGEPNAGSNGSAMFQTGNWYASVSGNSGTSFSYVNPYTLFPATGSFSGGFCCDQRVTHAPNQEMVLWFLQYSSTGSTANDTNGVRIAAAVGPSNLVSNTWCTIDFIPASFGIGLGQEFDFPNLQVSNNYIYATINLFSITSGTFTQAVMWRVPLTAFQNNCQGGTVTFWIVTNGFALGLTQNVTTTMYAGSISTSNSVRVYTQNESDTILSSVVVSGLNTTFFATPTCTGPDSNNWCARADYRIMAAWVAGGTIGFMWNSSQGSGRPQPFVRALRVSQITMTVVDQPDLWDNTIAWEYPAIAVNARGHLAGPVWFGSSTQAPSVTILIADDLAPLPPPWENHLAVTGTNGGNNAWGDYLGAQRHDQFTNTWIATGYTLQGPSPSNPGTPTSNVQVRFFWFGRERDTPVTGTAARFRVERTTGNVLADGSYNCGLSGSSSPIAPCFNVGIGADLAERIDVSEKVGLGDLVELDPQHPKAYRKARGSSLVSGVISSRPGMTLNNAPYRMQPVRSPQETPALSIVSLDDRREFSLALSVSLSTLSTTDKAESLSVSRLLDQPWLQLEGSAEDSRPLLALLGRVPVKATTENGPIHPGDLLVASATRPGYAMRCADPAKCEGAIVGKALEALESGEGLVLVLVTSR